jgi:hypothetical protein
MDAITKELSEFEAMAKLYSTDDSYASPAVVAPAQPDEDPYDSTIDFFTSAVVLPESPEKGDLCISPLEVPVKQVKNVKREEITVRMC